MKNHGQNMRNLYGDTWSGHFRTWLTRLSPSSPPSSVHRVQVKDTSPRRVGVDPANGEIWCWIRLPQERFMVTS